MVSRHIVDEAVRRAHARHTGHDARVALRVGRLGTGVPITTQDYATLSKLTGTGETVKNAADDMRGRKVMDKNGKDLGKVRDMFVDDRERKVRFLLVEHGGFLGIGDKKSFIPVDAITRTTSDDVYINDTRDHVADAPGYDPDLVNDRTYHSSVYSYYGCAPYWSAGYTYPGFNL